MCMKRVCVLTLAARDPLDADPPQDEHGAVVVDMQEADLVKLLSHDEEHCVQKLHSFRDVVPPQSRCYLQKHTTCRQNDQTALLCNYSIMCQQHNA